MKCYHSLTVLFLLPVFFACKKKDAPLLTSVEGKWRLAKVEGCFSGQGAPVTNKQEIVFHGNQYALFVNDVKENADTFHIKQVNNQTVLTIGKSDQFFVTFTTDAIILTPNLSDACVMTYGKLAY
ncbi:hypothetical protein [Chitinophaga sp.]|uniref:hypothetical protein n=1 Tax=Chitinophaga sp. TaxID=1869181 RepID=UPI002BBBF482|nr:hypothetical protein [Chitinophaga sp.]HWV67462.1 hypothetical protein [Chitinophaga sp.]